MLEENSVSPSRSIQATSAARVSPPLDLRERAQLLLQKMSTTELERGLGEVKELLEELTIHQVELELQGQELAASTEELALANRKLFQYFRHAPVPILRLDAAGNILECNLACRALLRAEENSDPRRFQMLFENRFTALTRRRWKQFLRRLKEQTENVVVEIQLQWPEGRTCDVLVTGVRAEEGESIVYLQDTTSLREAAHENERLALIAQRTDNGVVFTDVARKILWVNEGFTRMTGFTLEEVRGKNPGMLQGPATDHDAVQRMRCALERGEGFVEEVINYHKDGTPYWIRLEVNPLRDERGELSGFFALQSDVTARRQREEELLALRTAVEQSPSPFVMADVKGNITYVNPAFTKTTGYTKAEVLGRNPRLLKSGEQSEEFYSSMWNQLRRGETWAGILHNKRRDGSLFWSSSTIAPILDEGGRPAGFIGVMQDITKQIILQEQLEAALLEEKRHSSFIEGLLKSLPVGVFVRSRDGVVTHTNPAAAALCGYSCEEICRLPMAEREGEDQLRLIEEEDAKLWNEECEVIRAERTLCHRDGHFIPILITKAILHDEKGQVRGLVSAVVDITEIKQMERDLRESQQAAEAANRAKSAFLATMSHEIRTPLNAVIGMASLLAECKLNDEEREYVTTILSASETLLELLSDILDYSRIESEKLPLHPDDFPLRQLVLESVEMMRQQAHKKGLALDWQFDPEIPSVLQGDRVRLKQILLNLLGNAIKFTHQGSVHVGVNLKQVSPDSCTIEFLVRDTGIGIDEETQKMLFQPFTQADSSITREFGGSGLGLAISRQLCELMGGEIWLESEVGQGSAFYLRVPLARPAPSAGFH
jgi:nitrogen fixation negative regulator NifL